ncbi:metallophosphoesterase [Methanococcus voltae]|uniref:Phosphoesterase n=2 Tax=Methanococcus voltae TaxID=2188 RepID=A0A8J7URC7_METVO|nr:metallophosphoesterase [Methanococcus voltae]MBP2172932.1 putative phosphoesterase [Methanococcus voltae]MBP2201658.1 putative phosphoesterase [Methanococcus voltae]MCS3922446.1 putative phosphoesterase [Methanococcus voltae PS]
MKIGLISDTHDYLPNIRKAIQVFNRFNVDLVVHCGDFVSLFVISEFKNLNSKLYATYGNNDGEKTRLKEWLLDINPENKIEDSLSFDVENLKFFVLHGQDAEILDSVIRSKNYDVVLHGHTHEQKFEEVDGVLVINPGEAFGMLTGLASIGILNTSTKEYTEVDLNNVDIIDNEEN